MNSDLLTEHLATYRYGAFELTDAVRPGPTLPILPREGYRVRIYRDRGAQLRLPMLSASVSAEKLFDCFPRGRPRHSGLPMVVTRNVVSSKSFRDVTS